MEVKWPRRTNPPEPDEVVAVLMTEEMARRFEERCLCDNTRGRTCLSPPVLFSEDDIPTYMIETSNVNYIVTEPRTPEQIVADYVKKKRGN